MEEEELDEEDDDGKSDEDISKDKLIKAKKPAARASFGTGTRKAPASKAAPNQTSKTVTTKKPRKSGK